jgi:hypothetical protein
LNSITTAALDDATLEKITHGSGTTFPSTWSLTRLFYRTDWGLFFRNGGTVGTPIWKAVGFAGQFHETITFVEDFECATANFPVATSGHGRMNWYLHEFNVAGASGQGYGTIVASHPGIVEIVSAANGGVKLVMGSSATSQTIRADAIWEAEFIILTDSAVTTTNLFFGMGTQLQALTEADSCYIYYAAAENANWKTKTRTSSAETVNTSSVAVSASTWYILRIKRLSSSVEFYINDSLVATHTANIPTSGVVVFGMSVMGVGAGVIRRVMIDYVSLSISGVTRA